LWPGKFTTGHPQKTELVAGQVCLKPVTSSSCVFSDLAGELLAFHWEMVQGGEWCKVHPSYTTHKRLRRNIIPLRWHGDDASIKSLTGRKLCTLSLHSEFGACDPMSSRLISIMLYDDWVVPGKTYRQLMDVWHWSFEALLSGVYPASDHLGQAWPSSSPRFKLAGTSIANGWRFAFSGALGDWSFHGKFFKELHGSSHNFLCFRCAASKALHSVRFTDVGVDAGWRATCFSTSQFLAALPVEGRNQVYNIPGFCLSLVRCDFMHAAFLGIFQITCGNIIWELMELGHFAPVRMSIAQKLDFAFSCLHAYCREHGLTLDLRQFSPAVFNSPSDDRTIELHCKAHDCRVIVGWLASETSRSPDIATGRGRRRTALAWSQHNLCTTLETA
jgi:hypothetical protein